MVCVLYYVIWWYIMRWILFIFSLSLSVCYVGCVRCLRVILFVCIHADCTPFSFHISSINSWFLFPHHLIDGQTKFSGVKMPRLFSIPVRLLYQAHIRVILLYVATGVYAPPLFLFVRTKQANKRRKKLNLFWRLIQFIVLLPQWTATICNAAAVYFHRNQFSYDIVIG